MSPVGLDLPLGLESKDTSASIAFGIESFADAIECFLEAINRKEKQAQKTAQQHRFVLGHVRACLWLLGAKFSVSGRGLACVVSRILGKRKGVTTNIPLSSSSSTTSSERTRCQTEFGTPVRMRMPDLESIEPTWGCGPFPPEDIRVNTNSFGWCIPPRSPTVALFRTQNTVACRIVVRINPRSACNEQNLPMNKTCLLFFKTLQLFGAS